MPLTKLIIQITLSKPDNIVEMLGWVSLIVLWTLMLYYYSNLPPKIPTHFNAACIIENYSSRATILILPIIGSELFLLMSTPKVDWMNS